MTIRCVICHDRAEFLMDGTSYCQTHLPEPRRVR